MGGETPEDARGQPDDACRRELATAAVLVALAVAIVALSLRIELGVQTDSLGPRAFPLALGAAIGLCGLLLAASALAPGAFASAAAKLAEGGEAEPSPAQFSAGRLAAALAATAAYVAAFEPLGYLLATPLYVVAILVIHGGASRQAFLTAPVLVAAAFYAGFRFGLLVPVPDGVLERWLPW